LVELFEGGEKRKKYGKQYVSGGIKYSELKRELATAIYKELEPIQKRRKELERDSTYVDKILKDGAESARRIAKETVNEVKEKMGLK
jgi:tryptophanyl-tRNA synthetase